MKITTAKEEENKKIKVVIYARVSSAEQAKGYSVDAQVKLCRAWANKQGYSVVYVYKEHGHSARTDNRPRFQKMIRNLKLGEADGVVVHKTNRFARRLFDAIRYQGILKEYGVNIYSMTDSLLNSDDPKDILLTHITMAIDEYESSNIGSEAKKGLLAKAEAGHWPGSRLVLGYKRVGERREAKILIDPHYGPIMKDAFNSLATGRFSLLSWTKEAKARGYLSRKGKPISKSAWQKYFRDIFYIGKMSWKDNIYEGNHPPLINLKLWNQVQNILDQQSSGGKKKKHFWLLKGLLWSEPHARPMNGSISKGIYPYYVTKGRGYDLEQHTVPAESAENQVFLLLGKIQAVDTIWTAPDDWLLALRACPNVGLIFPHLPTDKNKHQFLKYIFLKNGLHVNRAGRVTAKYLRPGFKVVE